MKQGFFRQLPVLLLTVILLVLTSRTIIAISNLHSPFMFVQQDHYATYADALGQGKLASASFEDFDRRLLPFYPLLIYIVSLGIHNTIYVGIGISIVTSAIVTFLLWKLFPSPIPALLSAIFPPIWVKQGVKVATEPLFASVALASIFLYTKKNYFLSGLLCGLTMTIRPIGIALFGALGIMLFLDKTNKKQHILKFLFGFFLPLLLLVIFNFFTFGPKELFEQFSHGDRYGGLRLGFIQIAQDFYRTLDWHQYRIFFSGLFYVMINVLALVFLFKKRKRSPLVFLFFLWMLFSLLFILSPSPFTLLDDFGRYSLASLPPLLLGLTFFVNAVWKKVTGDTTLQAIQKQISHR